MVRESLDREAAMSHHGILNVNKPQGWTSHDVVAKLRKLLGMKKIGHAGTLDPAATGVLPILLGQATRLSEFLVEWDKEYTAVLRLGQETDTQDATGKVIRERPLREISENELRQVLIQFQGQIQQVPPMFSAVKIGGQALYKAARKGKVLPRQSRPVNIYQLELREMDGADIHLHITCSKGTYVRTLCADIGERLGVGGHLSQLERTRVGPFSVDTSLSLEKIQETLLTECHDMAFLSLDRALSHVPSILVNDEMIFKVKNGVPIPLSSHELEENQALLGLRQGSLVKIKDQSGNLFALGIYSHALEQERGFSGILIKKVFDEFSRNDRGESSASSKSLAWVGGITTSFPEGSVQCH